MIAMFEVRFCVVALATLVWCAEGVRGAPMDSSCHRVDGAQKLLYRGVSPCKVTREDDFNIVFSNTPGNNQRCYISFWTKEPNYMEVTPLEIDIGSTERIRMKTMLAFHTTLTSADVGVTSLAPVTQNTIYFFADAANSGSMFRIRVTSKNSGCNVVCKNVGTSFSMPIQFPAYRVNSYCQVWITAQRGLRVKGTFTHLTVGSQLPDGSCFDDFVAISMRGEAAYSFARSLKYCGTQTNVVVDSTNEKMFFILSGKAGGTPDVQGTFTVVDPSG